MTEGYDEAYERTSGLFGDEPEPLLVRGVDLLDRSRLVVDVGCGQGRNALWLAAQGFDVLAFDPSTQAVRQVVDTAKARGLTLDARHGGFRNFPDLSRKVGGVCVFGLMQILSRAEICDLAAAVDFWTSDEALLFVTAWTIEDPSFGVIAGSWRRIGENSFRHADGRIRTFFSKGEIVELFPDWRVVFHKERLGPWHRHGDGPEERHGNVELIARRNASLR